MSSNRPGIVFMGTPEFAVTSLDAIIQAGYAVKAVITSPDKPSGRGLQLHPSPVKQYAMEHSLKVMQPLKLKDPEFLDNLRNLHADLQVVVAFRMLPEEVWNMPPMGTFNLHASLLPQYRGAAPINWAIINGETKTGITTFLLNHEIDQGSVIFTESIAIGENENAGDIHDRLMVSGGRLVVKTIEALADGSATKLEQQFIKTPEPLKTAPKIFKNDCKISWESSAGKLHNLIRGLSPFPTAWSEIITGEGEILTVKIFASRPISKPLHVNPGTIDTDAKNFLRVAVSDGYMQIESLQLQGKRQLAVAEFLRGFPGIAGCRFQ